jgi:peptidoglycan/LPS O-acetylase OafA/YrhL
LVQTLTRTTNYGLVAGLLGIGLCVWGAATRVRRRLTVGSATLLLALFGMIAVPVAQAVPEFHAAALWIVLTAVGLVLMTIAVSLERGRARLTAAINRIDQLLQGWE